MFEINVPVHKCRSSCLWDLVWQWQHLQLYLGSCQDFRCHSQGVFLDKRQQKLRGQSLSVPLPVSDRFEKTPVSCIGQVAVSPSFASSGSQSFTRQRSPVKCPKLHARSHVVVNHRQHLAGLELCNLYRPSPTLEARSQYVGPSGPSSSFDNDC